VLSAANEVAVEAFLADEIRWCDVVAIVASTNGALRGGPLDLTGGAARKTTRPLGVGPARVSRSERD